MRRMLVVLLAGLLVSSSALAQDAGDKAAKKSDRKARQRPEKKSERKSEKAGQKTESARERLSRRFNEASPPLGELLPDVSGYTADGKPVSLRGLDGDFKVLVFGCLT
jgi:hypothetical protein